jgi:hypothetical protein
VQGIDELGAGVTCAGFSQLILPRLSLAVTQKVDILNAEKSSICVGAMTLLDRAIGRLRQEYAAQGKTTTND